MGVAFPTDMAITADEMDRQDIADRGGDLEANGAPSLGSGSLASSEATAVMSYNDQTNGSVADREGRGSGKGAKVLDKAMDKKSSQDLPSPATSTASGATPPGDVLINKKLHPIYFLFVAPPAAASIAWTEIAGEFDHLSKSLFFISGFLYMFLVLFNSSFLRNAPFSIAWWAYTFPCESVVSPMSVVSPVSFLVVHK